MHPFSSCPPCTWSKYAPLHKARARAANRPCMARRRRITTACFLDVIRAPCGGARSRRGTGGSYCLAGVLARGWPRPAPPACPRRGSERSSRRRRAGAGAGAGVMLADVAGSASSKGTTGRAGSTSPRGRRACVREESGEEASLPICGDHDRTCPIQRS